jgi:hypothetical protein
MANLSQTAANVALAGAGARVRVVQVGEAVTQGQPAYLNTADAKYYQADANASQSTAEAVGIFLTPASTNGYAVLAEGGGLSINLGATLTVGETYVVSATKGAICPIGDLTTGDYPCIIGTATSTSALTTSFYFSGVAK